MTAPWFAVDADAWPAIADALSASGNPWPREAVVADLRWWANEERRGRDMPRRVVLARRWGWTDWATRQAIADEGAWRSQPWETEAGPTALQPSTNRSPTVDQPPDNGSPSLFGDIPTDDQPPANRQPTARRHTRGIKEGNQESAITEADTPCPPWAGPLASGTGIPKADLVAGVVQVLATVRGKQPNPARCATDAKSIVSLWRATGKQPWPEFIADLDLVAQACQQSPDRLFSRDVRADGWQGGVDRSRDVATICRHDRWSARLDAARRWRDGGSASSSASWLDVLAPEDRDAVDLCGDPASVEGVLRAALASGRLDRLTARGVYAAWCAREAGQDPAAAYRRHAVVTVDGRTALEGA
jgi:hypothetical protein